VFFLRERAERISNSPVDCCSDGARWCGDNCVRDSSGNPCYFEIASQARNDKIVTEARPRLIKTSCKRSFYQSGARLTYFKRQKMPPTLLASLVMFEDL